MRVRGATGDWELWLGVAVVLIAAIGAALVPSQVLEPTYGSRSIAFSPKTFPFVTLSIMGLTGLAMIGKALFGTHERMPAPPDGPLRARALVPMLIMLVYVLLVDPLGIYVTSAVAIAALAWDLGSRSWITILTLALVVPTAMWLVFRLGLNVFLPEGTLFEGML